MNSTHALIHSIYILLVLPLIFVFSSKTVAASSAKAGRLPPLDTNNYSDVRHPHWGKSYNTRIQYAYDSSLAAVVAWFYDANQDGMGYWYNYSNDFPQISGSLYEVSLWVQTSDTNGVQIRAYTADNSSTERSSRIWTNFQTISSTSGSALHKITWRFQTSSSHNSDSLSFYWQGLDPNAWLEISQPTLTLLSTLTANGRVCANSSECSSGYCYPGPENSRYCLARSSHCAQPGTNGVVFGQSYTYNGKNYLCQSGVGLVLLNKPPVANAQSITTNEDVAKTITLSGSDPDENSLTYTIVTQPTKGTLSGSGANQTYTPNANANGDDSFTFKVNDGTTSSATATVSITITPVNDPPIAGVLVCGTSE